MTTDKNVERHKPKTICGLLVQLISAMTEGKLTPKYKYKEKEADLDVYLHKRN